MQITCMPDFYKVFWQDVLFKTTQKFCMCQHHYFFFVAIIVIFVGKTDRVIIDLQYPVSSNGYLVRIAAQVFYDLCRAAEGCIGMYIPCLLYTSDAADE